MYNNEDIRYKLERYRAGGSNRYVCPQCGRKKCFTRYVDVETGEYVGEAKQKPEIFLPPPTEVCPF